LETFRGESLVVIWVLANIRLQLRVKTIGLLKYKEKLKWNKQKMLNHFFRLHFKNLLKYKEKLKWNIEN